MKKKIVIRTDASAQIGTGHVMRCLTLAEGLRDKGAEVHFICRELSGHLIDLISKKGFSVHRLPCPASGTLVASEGNLPVHSPWLEVPWQQDLTESLNIMKTIVPVAADWLIVDHYALDCRWEVALRQAAKYVMAIDDIADRRHDCDLLLDQNLYSNMQIRYLDKIPDHCKCLLGTHYILLRDEFQKFRQQAERKIGPVRRILIFFGGSDKDNLTETIVHVLPDLKIKGLHVDVVIGAQHPNRDSLKVACCRNGYVCHIQTNQMAELMVKADLAIGAGGTTTWERFCLGLPAIVVSVAENQTPACKYLADKGLIVYLGSAINLNIREFQSSLSYLCQNVKELQKMSAKGRALVDGKGTARVYAEMIKIQGCRR